MSGHRLHFTIGPVQGFIGQARRTRDLWAGSFLLSCLSGMAMRAVKDHPGNVIRFPQVANDPLFDALQWDPKARKPVATGTGPMVGSLPNRFKAEIAEDYDPRIAAATVRAYWGHIAEIVRTRILQGRLDADQQAIWKRQIEGFFEIAWVKGPAPDDGSDGAWLDRRKNWRSQPHAAEPGDHCMLMGDLQELSGHVRAQGKGPEQLAFWEEQSRSIEAYLRKGDADRVFATLELGPTERLSAVALVKRLFPILRGDDLEEALGFQPAGKDDRQVRYWPSLAGIAAAPWLCAVHATAPAAAEDFVRTIRLAEQTETGEHASALSRAERTSPIPRVASLGAFGALDGKLVYDFAIEAAIADTHRGWLVAKNRSDQAGLERRVYTAAKDGLHPLLRAVAGNADTSGLAEGPKPFLALLQMDGDRVGTLLGPKGPGEEKVSKALGSYTERVKSIVRDAEGVLIYAGGDDVLALFSIDRALGAAFALHAAYGEAFQQYAGIAATTSAGLAFAHFGVPFTRITEESRRLLEDAAKDRNGRDSIAVSVTKQSGRQIEWCTTFGGLQPHAREPFSDLVGEFGRRVGDQQRYAGFVYNMRERYQAYLEPGDDGASPLADHVDALMLAEWLKGENTDRAGFDLEEEKGRLRQLQAVCQTWRNGDPHRQANALRMDGALLVKFLDDNLIPVRGGIADA